MTNPSNDIYIVGLGIVGYQQVTREVESALKNCKQILFLHYGNEITKYLTFLCPSVTDLSSMYETGLPRDKIYEQIAERVLNAASHQSPVGLAMYGHPFVYVSATRAVLTSAQRAGLRAKVLPGISAMDCLFIDLELDPASEGLQMYEATDLLLRRRPIQPDVPCLIWQIGAVGRVIHSVDKNKQSNLTVLTDYLLGFFDPQHKVTIAKAAIKPSDKPKLIETSLANLYQFESQITLAETLFIPSVHRRQIQDEAFLRSVIADSESGEGA